jgi:hypothetical protein
VVEQVFSMQETLGSISSTKKKSLEKKKKKKKKGWGESYQS